MRALALAVFLLGAMEARAQNRAPDTAASAPTSCSETSEVSRCQCRHGTDGALAGVRFPRAAIRCTPEAAGTRVPLPFGFKLE